MPDWTDKEARDLADYVSRQTSCAMGVNARELRARLVTIMDSALQERVHISRMCWTDVSGENQQQGVYRQ